MGHTGNLRTEAVSHEGTFFNPLKLIEALNIIAKRPGNESRPFPISLICGFTPLHLAQFLQAELQRAYPDVRPELHAGLYGDLLGNLIKAREKKPEIAVVLIEWADLDPRLGIRQLGGWHPQALAEIGDHVNAVLAQIEAELG